MELTIVRHGESESNAAGLWQGQHNSPLSGRGRRQAEQVGKRLASRRYDLVVASDLSRAAETAAAIAHDFELDPGWREMDIGRWESRPRAEIEEEDGELLKAVREGEDVPLGGGERFSEFEVRIGEALARLRERADEDSRILVVAHGGVIAAATRITLRLPKGPPALGPLDNTSLTTFRRNGSSLALVSYNDASHLQPLGRWARTRHEEGDTLVTLIRHGQTLANIESRWAGATDGDMTIDGHRQAAFLAGWYPGVDVMYSSPLRRARDTAGALAEALGIPLEHHDGLVEMHFGEWENLTTDEIQAGWRELWKEIFEEGRDLPRGGRPGEALAEAARRMQAAVAELTERHAGARIGVVSHGGAIRSLALDVLGVGHAGRDAMEFPGNTAVTHLIVGTKGTRLADYNLAPHLDPV